MFSKRDTLNDVGIFLFEEEKKLKTWSKFFIFSIVSLFFLYGCHSDPNLTSDDSTFQYKDSYVGDNSAVINLITQLEGSDHLNGLELKTKEEPYGIIINYDWIDIELNHQETAINNASYLFTLIQNVDWINFRFDMGSGVEEYTVTREELDDWYNAELFEINNEDKLKDLMQETSEQKTTADFFN